MASGCQANEPPTQVVYRFDDHRYLELKGWDCEGELWYTSLYINLCNCLILICSIQHQKQVNLWTKNSCRLWLTNWPKIS
ncbi:hypothetical protein ABKV41_23645, partial [Enterobacter roggenkampii]